MNVSSNSEDARRHLARGIERQKNGSLGEARSAYLEAVDADPTCGVAYHNLGVVQAHFGDWLGAADYFERALAVDRTQDLFWLSYLRILIRLEDWKRAISVYYDFISNSSSSGPAIKIAEMFCSAGVAQPGGAGSREFSQILFSDERYIGCLISIGEQFCARKQFGAATALFKGWLAIYPDCAPVELALGRALEFEGGISEAVEIYRGLVSRRAGIADAHYQLGMALLQSGDVKEGFEHLMTRARLVSMDNKFHAVVGNPPHRIKHDREQGHYLKERGIHLGEERNYFYLADGSRVEGCALNAANGGKDILHEWRARQFPIAIVDDFLSPEALSKLQRYFAESTIWRRDYDAGYIGAVPQDGLACPLMAQIVEELMSSWPNCFKSHNLSYVGAFKYDSVLSKGTNTHADFAAINVNFYIAPDEANEDPETGGLRVWNKSLDDIDSLRRYNSDETSLNRMLEQEKPEQISIPHKCNRAIIFKSNLIHKTDVCRFKEGFLHKRINVSLLFGKLGDLSRLK